MKADVGHEDVARSTMMDLHCGVADARALPEGCLDLAALDPDTPHLDLPIGTANELHLPVEAHPRHVPGAIEPRARDG